MQQIYEKAEKLDLDLRAQAYTIAFVSVMPEQHGVTESYSDPGRAGGTLPEIPGVHSVSLESDYICGEQMFTAGMLTSEWIAQREY